MKIESDVFKESGMIPRKYTCDDDDISPPLTWSDVPAGTVSLALICDDPDAPMLTWVHWIVYNISPETSGLREGIGSKESAALGISQGLNSWRRANYGGPCPPGHSTHRYFFKLYATDLPRDLKPNMSKRDLEKAMRDHIIAQAQLIGVYSRG